MMDAKPIDAVAVLVGFLAWCNEAPNQQHPVVENTRRLCDALAQTLRERAALEAQLAEAERDAARYRFLRGDGEDQSAYWPEEMGLWGGQELDDAIDAELRKAAG